MLSPMLVAALGLLLAGTPDARPILAVLPVEAPADLELPASLRELGIAVRDRFVASERFEVVDFTEGGKDTRAIFEMLRRSSRLPPKAAGQELSLVGEVAAPRAARTRIAADAYAFRVHLQILDAEKASISGGVEVRLDKRRWRKADVPVGAAVRCLADQVAAGQRGTDWNVELASDPPMASVKEGQRKICSRTPCRVWLDPGRHLLKLQAPLCHSKEVELLVPPGRTVVREWELEPSHGVLLLEGGEEGTEVTMDGQPMAALERRAWWLEADVEHEVRVTSPCRESRTELVRLVVGEERKLDLDLAVARLRVWTIATDTDGRSLPADVFVDGLHAGRAPGSMDVPACAKRAAASHPVLGAVAVELDGRTLADGVPLAFDLASRFAQDVHGTRWVRIPGSPGSSGMGAFEITRTEITVEEYGRCVASAACGAPGRSSTGKDAYNGDRADRMGHPINGVSWKKADSYCRWAGGRLPTEQEWEYAAWGTAGSRGRMWDQVPATGGRPLANIADESARRASGQTYRAWKTSKGYDDGYAGTAPVGTFSGGASPWGAVDMAGNVAEWTADAYEADLLEAESGRIDTAELDLRIVRGSHFGSYGPFLAPGYRYALPASRFTFFVGFRCARRVDGAEASREQPMRARDDPGAGELEAR